MNIINVENKKAILFDSGKVLNGPTTGHWFVIPSFFNYVDKEEWDRLDDAQLREAFTKALKYVDSQPLISTREEEYTHFIEYYNILFECLDTITITNGQIKLLAYDYVYKNDKYTFFDDVKEVISKLYNHYKLAIVSDAWPSLEHIYIHAGLRNYFESFVISSQLGTLKPAPHMYETALKELGVTAEEAIFIDDNPKNCEGAIALGIDAVLLCRDQSSYSYYKNLNTLTVISGLNQLEEIFLNK